MKAFAVSAALIVGASAFPYAVRNELYTFTSDQLDGVATTTATPLAPVGGGFDGYPVDSAVYSTTTASAHLTHVPSGHFTAVPTTAPRKAGHQGHRPSGTGRFRPTGTGYRAPVSTGGVSVKNGTGSAGSAGSAGSGEYKMYSGDGSSGAGWPGMDEWVSDFDALWALQQTALKSSCKNIFGANEPRAADNSDGELADLKAAIQSVAAAATVDPRFALAVVMQESGGCVRAYNTSSPGDHINNPGLMQDHNGLHSCNTGANEAGTYHPGAVAVPCPKEQITGMVEDGVRGTAAGDGLQKLLGRALADAPAAGAQQYYVAARLYNAGNNPQKDLGAPGATRCYCSDIANRLTGWHAGETKCTLDKQAAAAASK